MLALARCLVGLDLHPAHWVLGHRVVTSSCVRFMAEPARKRVYPALGSSNFLGTREPKRWEPLGGLSLAVSRGSKAKSAIVQLDCVAEFFDP
jgi:hypothetical protein